MALLERGPFDLVLGADLLYDCTLAEALGALIPQIAPAALFAYAWKRLGDPAGGAARRRTGFRIAQWRPGGKGPRLLEAVRDWGVSRLAGQGAQALENRVRDAPDDQLVIAGEVHR